LRNGLVMPWIIQFSQDTEVIGVGTATAVYTDDAGKVIVSHSSRVDTNSGDGAEKLIDAAIAKLAEQQSHDSQISAVIAKLETVLNERLP